MATIYNIRPDIPLNKEIEFGIPISSEIPLNEKQKSSLMLASDYDKNMDPTGW